MRCCRCDITRETEGVLSAVVVVQHHPVLQRKGDKAVQLYCYFTTQDKLVTNSYDVLADTVDKAAKEWKSPAECSTGVRVARVAASATDALTWQLLASVFWPGSVIHLIVAASTKTLESLPGIPAAAATAADALPVDVSGPILLAAIPTALGLITIPFIVEPIDEAVHKVCDASVRPAFKYATRAYAKSDAGTPTEGPEWEGEDQIDFGKAALGAGILAGALALPPALFALSDFVEAL